MSTMPEYTLTFMSMMLGYVTRSTGRRWEIYVGSLIEMQCVLEKCRAVSGQLSGRR